MSDLRGLLAAARAPGPEGVVIVYCQQGYASALRDIGMRRAGDLDGGIDAWAAAGLPLAR